MSPLLQSAGQIPTTALPRKSLELSGSGLPLSAASTPMYAVELISTKLHTDIHSDHLTSQLQALVHDLVPRL